MDYYFFILTSDQITVCNMKKAAYLNKNTSACCLTRTKHQTMLL